jgi:hypothetical protein
MAAGAIAGGMLALTPGSAHAQSGDAILDLLTKKGIITQREANEIREQADVQVAQAVETYNKLKTPSWLDSFKWYGDLRLRGEYFDNNDQAAQTGRLRFRYRMRLGLEAKMLGWTTVGVRLASGDANDPVSTNETFDDSFQKDPVYIDAAYVTIKAPTMDWASLTAGKMNNPMYQPVFNSPLVYDGDLTPEGVAEQVSYAWDKEQRHKVFLNAGQFLLNEISGSSDTDGYLFDIQGGVEFAFGGEPKKPVLLAKLAAGFLFTEDANVGGQQADSPNLGNTVDNTGNILADFEVLHVGGEVAWQISSKPFLGTPAVLTVGGEYVKNLAGAYKTLSNAATNITALGEQTDGFGVQAAFGGNKKKGEWQIAYQYKYLEADAVYDAFTDSDWGTGGTDRKGHVVKATYNIFEWWQVAFAGFITEKISNRTGPNTIVAGRPDEDLLRVQVDSTFKF